ncbi:hypothetical protein SAMN02745912_03772 [Paramaledivibacter caminithermalis DSM 15212]|jgi:hypothetical protein|uniref:Uncharacterized protein n=2 Tax=Paramaledivibacter TaxID=1884934 RepID=A0A1M6TRH7_PARC5|nr:hypothetical protein SAMN02745912_03772 [Paramaledivibacter caminithermalis DSM 15212]
MLGRTIANLLIITMIPFIIILFSTYYMHVHISERINEINYNIIEVVATSGEFTNETYNTLKDSINRYGDYKIKIRYDKKIKPGIYDTYFDKADIIDQKFKIGDKITIYLEDKKLSLFGRLINAFFLGFRPENYIDVHIKSIKSCVVVNNPSVN